MRPPGLPLPQMDWRSEKANNTEHGQKHHPKARLPWLMWNLMRNFSHSGPAQEKEKPPLPPVTKAALIIDDDSIFRAMHRTCVCELGFDRADVKEVEDGVSGLAALKANLYDAVLSDYEMPEMDGLAMVKAFRVWEAGQGGRRRQSVFCITGANEKGWQLASIRS